MSLRAQSRRLKLDVRLFKDVNINVFKENIVNLKHNYIINEFKKNILFMLLYFTVELC